MITLNNKTKVMTIEEVKQEKERLNNEKVYSQKDVDKMLESERNFCALLFTIFFIVSAIIILLISNK